MSRCTFRQRLRETRDKDGVRRSRYVRVRDDIVMARWRRSERDGRAPIDIEPVSTTLFWVVRRIVTASPLESSAVGPGSDSAWPASSVNVVELGLVKTGGVMSVGERTKRWGLNNEKLIATRTSGQHGLLSLYFDCSTLPCPADAPTQATAADVTTALSRSVL